MTQFSPNPYKKRSRSDGDVLFRGILCVLIGLGVLVSPHFMGASGLRDMVAGAWLVGWFSLGLGLMFVVQFFSRKSRSKKP